MSYDREQWEEKSFQVITEIDGSVRSGYFPTGEGLVDGNVAIDYAFGNMPLQPNEDRYYKLSANDSHAIALTEWNSYPGFASAANYMITAAKALGGGNYEYTSQNNLKVGDQVRITGCGWANSTAPIVTYADATKFRTSDDLGEPSALTGLIGRADVFGGGAGRTLDDGESFYWPAVGLCSTWGIGENKLETVKKELIACGVPASWLTDAQWTGGANSYDDETGTYDTNSGRIFYYYIDPSSDMGYDATGVMYYGADFDGTVMYGSEGPNYKSGNQSADKNDFYLVVFQSHTPGFETADWL